MFRTKLLKGKSLLVLFALVYASNATAAPEEYIIDTKGAHASIEFRTLHLGYSWLVGRFNEFDGTFTFDEENDDNNKISVAINVDSIDSNHAERDKHLRSDKYLDTKKYPNASFVSTSIVKNDSDGYTVTGDFTLRETTREIKFDVTEVGAGNDPWGGFRRGFVGETEISFRDYGYTFFLGPATTKAELRLSIEGIRQ